MLLATIRNLGACLCPRCKVKKNEVDQLGTKRDEARRVKEARISTSFGFKAKVEIARNAVDELGKTIKSVVVEALLSADSLVPTSVRTHFKLFTSVDNRVF